MATADKEAFERAVKCYQGSADHEVGNGRNTTSADIIINLLPKVAIVIHNAGTLGQDGRKITVSFLILHCVKISSDLIPQDMTDMDEMQAYYRVNLFHVICLNSVFTNLFPKSRMAYINISRCAQ